MDLDLAVMLAYIDPGSGSLFLQVLIASVFGSGVYFHTRVQDILSWIKHKILLSKD